ncbi:hypothetical protein BJY04DRAFT_188059, partial [Aspergillus karnatakaensis]|uniref:WXG100 family type VII secretion target n=1 Tax=Aspergillus karnatakaensis TaxID=1810916 RepID=UPI003CCDA53F
MYFSKITITTLFTAVAVAAPAPAPQISVDLGQIQAVSQNLQSVCQLIANNVDSAVNDYSVIGPSLGQSSASFDQLYGSFKDVHSQLQEVCAKIVSAYGGAFDSYEQTETANTVAWSL